MENEMFDVIILGGGFAGLTLSLQLINKNPHLSILIIEKNIFPYPEAAHKVGESTVEVSANYLYEKLGIREHLDTAQLPKLGLRCFFKAYPDQSIEERVELGSNSFPPAPSWQLDRGKLENYLAKLALSKGITIIDDSRVVEVDLNEVQNPPKPHSIKYQKDRTDFVLSSKWVVDSSGRASIIKHEKDLQLDTVHQNSSAWFRINYPLNMDNWFSSPNWSGKNSAVNSRRYSTNHLMGEGYWVWVIPLSGDKTSVGIVADPTYHPLTTFNTIEKAREWLKKYEPECMNEIDKCGGEILDFLAIKKYPRASKEMFSRNRWGLTGDAGYFIDPLYSFGNDFISIANTLLTDLITKDFSSDPFEHYIEPYQQIYLGFAKNTFKVFENQYGIIRSPIVMPVKIAFDFAYYWSFIGFVVIQNQLTNLRFFSKFQSEMKELETLNLEMQVFFRNWCEVETRVPSKKLLELLQLPYMYELNHGLSSQVDSSKINEIFAANFTKLFWVGREIVDFARETSPNLPIPEILTQVEYPERLFEKILDKFRGEEKNFRGVEELGA